MRRGVIHTCGHHWSYECGPASERMTQDGISKRIYCEGMKQRPCPRCGGYTPLLEGFEDDPAKWSKPDFIETRETVGPPGMWDEVE